MTKTEEGLLLIMSDIERLEQTDTGEFMVNPKTSAAIEAVLLAQKAIEECKAVMVERFKNQALEIDPTFKGIQGNGVRASYKATGAAFKVTEGQLVPPLVLKTTYGVDAKGLKSWQKDNGGPSVLPPGVEPLTDRTMSLSFTLVKGIETEEE